MRKLILFNMVSLDGFFEGPGGDISWHMVDDEFNQFSEGQIQSVDEILFGRITYELMANFWPSAEALKTDPIIAGLMNSHHKIVFSNTIKAAKWSNSRLVKGSAAEEIRRLKLLTGRDMIIFGSERLTCSLVGDGLIDEFRLMINPVILGKGRPMFTGIEKPIHLLLRDSRVFHSGNILSIYEPEKG